MNATISGDIYINTPIAKRIIPSISIYISFLFVILWSPKKHLLGAFGVICMCVASIMYIFLRQVSSIVLACIHVYLRLLYEILLHIFCRFFVDIYALHHHLSL